MPCENSTRKRSKTMAFLGAQAHMRDGRLERYEQAGLHHRQATDTQVEVKPSVSVQKGLRGSMAELAKEVRLAASYGEMSESLQRG